MASLAEMRAIEQAKAATKVVAPTPAAATYAPYLSSTGTYIAPLNTTTTNYASTTPKTVVTASVPVAPKSTLETARAKTGSSAVSTAQTAIVPTLASIPGSSLASQPTTTAVAPTTVTTLVSPVKTTAIVPKNPALVIPNYPYEYEGLPGETDTPGAGPTSASPGGYSADWEIRWVDSPTGGGSYGWFLKEPVAEQSTTKSSGGGGSGGGGSSSGGSTEDTTEGLLGDLAWWPNADSTPPLLRNWASWLRELVESNKATVAIANPFAMDAEAVEAAATLDEGGAAPAEGYRRAIETIARIKELLGLEFAEGESSTSMWQKFINAIPNANLEAQQLLASLRYDADNGVWYAVDIPQLVNPQYT